MYIRTKYEIVEVETIADIQTKVIFKDNFVAQSETIEELCDRFVVIDKETKEVMNIVAFLEYAKLWVSWKYNIYGAIWTSKGLIYVAKMNDKGELELI